MKISLVIILVNYNGFDDTKACLESISKTGGKSPYVVLVDNASKEEKDLRFLKTVYPELKIIYNKENIGFGRANNVGIKWARNNIDFHYLLLLNSDTLIEPKSLFYLKEAFRLHPRIGIATSRIMYEAKRNIVWYGGGDINYKRGWPKISDFNKKPTERGANKSRYVTFASGCVMMFSKESIKYLEGFDDEFFMYCEDLEICMRTQKRGFKIYYEANSVIYHKVQGSFGEENRQTGMKAENPNLDFLFYNMKSNQWIAMRKSLQGMSFLRFNIYYWSKFFYQNLKFLIQGHYAIFKTSLKIFNRIISY